MNVFDENTDKELLAKHGQAAYYSDTGSVSSINPMFFADLFYFYNKPVYEPAERRFYFYNPDTGAWEKMESNLILNQIWRMVFDYSKQFSQKSLESKCPVNILRNVMLHLSVFATEKDFFASNKQRFIHCNNGFLVYDNETQKWTLEPFSPDFHSRNRSSIIYDPAATCPQFIEKLVLSAMCKEDAKLLQLYVGQCLLGRNLSQTFLMLTGTASGGKSTLVNVIELLIGRHNCTELRLEHMSGRFELQRLVSKTLLTGKDVKSNFLNTGGAYKLKSLVGNDTMTIESKGLNDSADILGSFNAIITCNNNLRVSIDGDHAAWKRRMLWIKYNNPPPDEVIVDFDLKLIETQSSGILNWALEGAAELLRLGGKIPRSDNQNGRINNFMQESDSVNAFVSECVKRAPDSAVTISELLVAYSHYCQDRKWQPLPEREFQTSLPDIMLKTFNAARRNDVDRDSKAQRGYVGFIITPSAVSQITIPESAA